MQAVPWYGILETGHVAMDVDHRKLVDLFNLLGDSIKDCKGKDFCDSVLDNIIQDAKTSFVLEETLMAKHHYPKADEHMAEHAAMIERALNYRISLDVNSARAYMTLVHFAEVWLCYHILFFDKELADFLGRIT